MKKQTSLILAAMLATLTISGCGNKPAETTSATTAATTAATAAATEAPAETTTTEATEAVSTAAATTEDNSNKTALFTAADGTVFYREDGTFNEYGQLEFPYTVARIATGLYITSDEEPDSFVTDEFIYNGTRAELGTVIKVSAGDEFAGCKVKTAKTTLTPPWNSDAGEFDKEATEGYTVGSTDIVFDGDVTLTGILRYYFDEQYAIASGDIQFIPDSCYKGMPVVFDISGSRDDFGVQDFDAHGGFDPDIGLLEEKWGGNVCVYSDSHILHLGNLRENYADRTELIDLLDGANANCTKKVAVTISELKLNWSDNFGSFYSCNGKINDIKDIKVLG